MFSLLQGLQFFCRSSRDFFSCLQALCSFHFLTVFLTVETASWQYSEVLFFTAFLCTGRVNYLHFRQLLKGPHHCWKQIEAYTHNQTDKKGKSICSLPNLANCQLPFGASNFTLKKKTPYCSTQLYPYFYKKITVFLFGICTQIHIESK